MGAQILCNLSYIPETHEYNVHFDGIYPQLFHRLCEKLFGVRSCFLTLINSWLMGA